MSIVLKKGSWTAKTEQIPLSQIDKDEANRKTLTNLDKLEADIVRAGGIYYPIIVSPYVKAKEIIVGKKAIKYWIKQKIPLNQRRFMIFDGERRYVAYLHLGWTTIPAFIRTEENLMELHELQFASNAKREDMNPLDMAKAIDRYIKEYTASTGLGQGIAIKRICQLTDWSKTHIEGRLDILQMPESIQNDVQRGFARANFATELLNNIPEHYQPRVIERAEKHELISVLELRGVGKQLDLLDEIQIDPAKREQMADSVIGRGGRFEYDIDAKPDLPAYLFEANAFRKRVSCWNIEGATVKELEEIAGVINETLTLFRNMQKEELSVKEVGELKEKQWYKAKKP